jgi:hypothetical protein
VGAPGFSAESSFTLTAATTLIVAVAWTDADAGLGPEKAFVSAAAAAAMNSMDSTGNALARKW